MQTKEAYEKQLDNWISLAEVDPVIDGNYDRYKQIVNPEATKEEFKVYVLKTLFPTGYSGDNDGQTDFSPFRD